LAELRDAQGLGNFGWRQWRFIRDLTAGEERLLASAAEIKLALHNPADARQAAVRAIGFELDAMVGAYRQLTGIPQKPFVWFSVVLEAFGAPF
jgi:hypothetical protein